MSQLDSLCQRLPGFPHARASSGLEASLASGGGDGRRVGLADEAGLLIQHDLEWPAGVACRHHRLLREERLVRDEAEVLVDGGVEDAEARGVQARELGVVDPPDEPEAVVEP